MKNKEAQELPQDNDRHLDVPAEANRDRHINYLADADSDAVNDNEELTDRQKRWKEGLEEGRKERDSE